MNVVSKTRREKWTPLKTWSQSSRAVLKWTASTSFPYKHSLSRLELHVTICYYRSCLQRQGRRQFLCETLNTTVLRPDRATVTTCTSTQPQNSNHSQVPVTISLIFAAIKWFHLEPLHKSSYWPQLFKQVFKIAAEIRHNIYEKMNCSIWTWLSIWYTSSCIHFVVCLTTGPLPLPQRLLDKVQVMDKIMEKLDCAGRNESFNAV
jgi:hypothetical protein